VSSACRTSARRRQEGWHGGGREERGGSHRATEERGLTLDLRPSDAAEAGQRRESPFSASDARPWPRTGCPRSTPSGGGDLRRMLSDGLERERLISLLPHFGRDALRCTCRHTALLAGPRRQLWLSLGRRSCCPLPFPLVSAASVAGPAMRARQTPCEGRRTKRACCPWLEAVVQVLQKTRSLARRRADGIRTSCGRAHLISF
jgi:hypothetical protein